MKSRIATLALIACVFAPDVNGQQAPQVPANGNVGIAPGPLREGPQILDAGGQPIRVVVIKGLDHPWALAVLPNLDILLPKTPGDLYIE